MQKTVLLRPLAVLLALSVLSGCAENGGGASSSPEPEPVRSGTIAYVPLDDRPDNTDRVVYLAESLGYTLAMPEADLYRTRLDGQPRNANGTQYGDRAALYAWVLEQEAAGCDRYILSLDQLLSGGLVNSRHCTGTEPITLADGQVRTEAELAEALLDALAADPDNRVWLLDSVMRLAPTCGYAGFDLADYNQLRSYGMQPRPALEGEALTLEQVLADYPLASDGSPVTLPDGTEPEAEAVEAYLSARARKLRLSDEIQRLCARPGGTCFRLLIGIDDSSEADSIQKNEIAYLRSRLRTDSDGTQLDWILSGVDDLAFKAVTQLYLTESTQAHGGRSLQERGYGSVGVEYFGGTEAQPACAYDSQPLEEIVQEHLRFFGLSSVSGEQDAAVRLLVLTQPEDPAQKSAYIQALVLRLNELEQQGCPVMLIDAGNGLYGTEFHEALTRQAHLGWLLSYAGFLDMAIVTGTALSHGIARWAWLCDGNGTDLPSARAFAQTLSDSVIKDFCYKNQVREDILRYVRSDLGGSADNFWQPEIDRDAVTARLEQGMRESTRPVLKNFSGSTLPVSADPLSPGGTWRWPSLTLSGYAFPWDRAFEISMQIAVGTFRS